LLAGSLISEGITVYGVELQ